MNKKFVYCIECGTWEFPVELPIWGLVHPVYTEVLNDRGEVEGIDSDLCYLPGGFAFCAPPAVDPDWVKHVVEPGDDEALIIEVQSIPLMQELEAA